MYDVRFLKLEVRRAIRSVFRGVMGERMIPILRMGADFLGRIADPPIGVLRNIVLKYDLRGTVFEV